MSWIVLGFISLQFLAGAVAVGLSIAAWRHRDLAGLPAVYLGLASTAVVVYALGYALELTSRNLPAALTWARVEYLGIPYIVPMWLAFALHMSGYGRWISWRRIPFLLAIPVVTQVVALTTEWHSLFYIDPRLLKVGPFYTLAFDKGPFYWLHLLFVNGCLLFTTLVLAQTLARSAPAFRRQALFFMAAMAIGWGGLVIYAAGYSPYNLDLTPATMSLAGLVVAIGLFRFQGLEVVPLARDVIFDRMGDGVLVFDAADRLIDFNPAMQAMLPQLHKTQIGQPAAQVLAAQADLLAQITAGAPGPVELEVNGTGKTHYYQSHLSPVLDGRRRVAGKIVTLQDYSQTRQLIEQMRDLATHDPLTGCNNRRHFTELALREIERLHRHAGAISLICVDLDHFKIVNDTYGHAAGDTALQLTAALLTRMSRKTDVLARLGGEEFLLLLPETPPAAALATAERLRQALEQQTMTYEGRTMTVTGSFGVTGLDQAAGVSLETMLRCADKAVYDAKALGRNCVAMRKLE